MQDSCLDGRWQACRWAGRRDFAKQTTGKKKPIKTLNFKDSRRGSGGKTAATAE
jgi:hypothetical protein